MTGLPLRPLPDELLLLVAEELSVRDILSLMSISKASYDTIKARERSIAKAKIVRLLPNPALRPTSGLVLSSATPDRRALGPFTFEAVGEVERREARIAKLFDRREPRNTFLARFYALFDERPELSDLGTEQREALLGGFRSVCQLTDRVADVEAEVRFETRHDAPLTSQQLASKIRDARRMLIRDWHPLWLAFLTLLGRVVSSAYSRQIAALHQPPDDPPDDPPDALTVPAAAVELVLQQGTIVLCLLLLPAHEIAHDNTAAAAAVAPAAQPASSLPLLPPPSASLIAFCESVLRASLKKEIREGRLRLVARAAQPEPPPEDADSSTDEQGVSPADTHPGVDVSAAAGFAAADGIDTETAAAAAVVSEDGGEGEGETSGTSEAGEAGEAGEVGEDKASDGADDEDLDSLLLASDGEDSNADLERFFGHDDEPGFGNDYKPNQPSASALQSLAAVKNTESGFKGVDLDGFAVRLLYIRSMYEKGGGTL